MRKVSLGKQGHSIICPERTRLFHLKEPVLRCNTQGSDILDSIADDIRDPVPKRDESLDDVTGI